MKRTLNRFNQLFFLQILFLYGSNTFAADSICVALYPLHNLVVVGESKPADMRTALHDLKTRILPAGTIGLDDHGNPESPDIVGAARPYRSALDALSDSAAKKLILDTHANLILLFRSPLFSWAIAEAFKQNQIYTSANAIYMLEKFNQADSSLQQNIAEVAAARLGFRLSDQINLSEGPRIKSSLELLAAMGIAQDGAKGALLQWTNYFRNNLSLVATAIELELSVSASKDVDVNFPQAPQDDITARVKDVAAEFGIRDRLTGWMLKKRTQNAAQQNALVDTNDRQLVIANQKPSIFARMGLWLASFKGQPVDPRKIKINGIWFDRELVAGLQTSADSIRALKNMSGQELRAIFSSTSAPVQKIIQSHLHTINQIGFYRNAFGLEVSRSGVNMNPKFFARNESVIHIGKKSRRAKMISIGKTPGLTLEEFLQLQEIVSRSGSSDRIRAYHESSGGFADWRKFIQTGLLNQQIDRYSIGNVLNYLEGSFDPSNRINNPTFTSNSTCDIRGDFDTSRIVGKMNGEKIRYIPLAQRALVLEILQTMIPKLDRDAADRLSNMIPRILTDYNPALENAWFNANQLTAGQDGVSYLTPEFTQMVVSYVTENLFPRIAQFEQAIDQAADGITK